MKRFREYVPNQTMLLPPDLREWLPTDHPVYFVDQAVDHLDLSRFYAGYKGVKGQPPYSVPMMVKILVYAYWTGIRSSRKIERALTESLPFRILAANQHPDFWTIAHFRRRHQEALGELLKQVVQLGIKAGLVRLQHAALDGTKIKAYASKHSAMSYGHMEQSEKEIQEHVQEYLRRSDQEDREENQQFGNSNGFRLPEHLATAEKRLKAIQEAKKALEEEARAKAAQRPQQKGKTKESDSAVSEQAPKNESEQPVKPEAKAQWNFTDPESRIMRNSDKAFVQAYNAQVVVDADSLFIVAGDLTQQSADAPHLKSMVTQTEENTQLPIQNLLADAGYFNEGSIQELSKSGIRVYIPPEKIRHSLWRKRTLIRGRIPKNFSLKDRMRRLLRTQYGRKIYRKRQTSVEPTFGHIKENMGVRPFNQRGLQVNRHMWRFTCAVYDLFKLFRAGVCPERLFGANC